MTKRYKLLKDMPGIKSGSEVRWSEATGGYRYFAPDHFIVPHNFEDDMRDTIRKDLVENNPDWFQEIKEPERIEVVVFNEGFAGQTTSIRPKNPHWAIPKEKNDAIKQAIEDCLNGYKEYTEGYWVHRDMVNKMAEISGKKYTQQQMDEAIEKAFEESRKTHPMIGFKHPTLQDYLSSLKQESK